MELTNRTLHIPSASKPDNRQNELPFVFIGGEKSAPGPDFLEPFSQGQLAA
jgi:hypothetical protein